MVGKICKTGSCSDDLPLLWTNLVNITVNVQITKPKVWTIWLTWPAFLSSYKMVWLSIGLLNSYVEITWSFDFRSSDHSKTRHFVRFPNGSQTLTVLYIYSIKKLSNVKQSRLVPAFYKLDKLYGFRMVHYFFGRFALNLTIWKLDVDFILVSNPDTQNGFIIFNNFWCLLSVRWVSNRYYYRPPFISA
jgi:hypothetical protein